jgi:uncharacterized membrane protein
VAKQEQLPQHVLETVAAIHDLHLRHLDEASRFELFAERVARNLGQPVFLAALTVLIAAWAGVNVLTPQLRFDPPPFFWLTGLLTVFAVYMTLLILAGQRRSERLASDREQLTLQLALLNEQKSAKIISLLEEFRRDSPAVANRDDPEADAMAATVDPGQVTEAIRKIEE